VGAGKAVSPLIQIMANHIESLGKVRIETLTFTAQAIITRRETSHDFGSSHFIEGRDENLSTPHIPPENGVGD
jgi:hypothetical protein